MIRRPPRSTQSRSSSASDVYKRQRQRKPRLRSNWMPRLEGGDLVIVPRPKPARLRLDPLDRGDRIVLAPPRLDRDTHEDGQKLPKLVRGSGRLRLCAN